LIRNGAALQASRSGATEPSRDFAATARRRDAMDLADTKVLETYFEGRKVHER